MGVIRRSSVSETILLLFFQFNYVTVPPVWSVKELVPQFVVEKSNWSLHSPDLNPTLHLWDELDHQLWVRPYPH